MKRFYLLLLLLLPLSAHATTTVTGHIADLGTTSQTNTFVRFTLKGCAGGQPRVLGTALIAPTQGASWYKDFPADSSGNVSGTIYSTRDSTGLLGGDIDCNGSTSSVWYGMTIWQGGKSGPEIPVHANSGTTLNVSTVAPLITTPTVGPGQVLTQSFNCPIASALTTWTCVHNFADLNVEVMAYDLNGKQIFPDTLTIIDSNTVTLTWVTAQAGKAIIMHGGSVVLASSQPNAIVSNPTGSQSITGQALTLGASVPLNVGGTATFTGNFVPKIIDNMQIVDSTFSRSGIDIGDEINKAYAALPANGGDIQIFCSATASRYDFSTPIVFTTANKIVRLHGMCPATPSPIQGLTLNYTPTTATSAITLDYDNGASGGGQNSHVAIEGITLMNNLCETVGGCGSSATGINVGNTNGAQSAVFKDMRISGFGTGVNNPNNNSWGQVFDNVGFTYNTTGMNYANAENTTLSGTKFVSNGTGITTSGGELTMLGGSLDSNSTVGFTCTGSAGPQTNYLVGVHMENNNGQATGGANLTSHFISGTCNFVVIGGIMENDNRSSGGTSDWLANSSGGTLFVSGTEMYSFFSGVLTTGYFNLVSPVRAHLEFTDASPTIANPSCGGTGCAAASIKRIPSGTNNNPVPWALGDTTFNTTVGIGDAFFAPNTSTALHLRFNGNNLDAIRMEDSTNVHTADCGPSIGGTTLFACRDITNSRQMFQYSYSVNTFAVPAITPLAAAGGDVGSTSVPFGNLWLGTAATNNFKFQPAATSGARIITIADPLSPTTVAMPLVIANGTAVMTTAAITAPACGTTVTVAATGVLTTDKIDWSFNAAPAGTNAGLVSWPTAGNVNFAYCPGVTETPAAATINWSVRRP